VTGFAGHLGLVNLRVLFSQVGLQLDVTSGFVATLAGVYGAPLGDKRVYSQPVVVDPLLAVGRIGAQVTTVSLALMQVFAVFSESPGAYQGGGAQTATVLGLFTIAYPADSGGFD